MHHFFVHDVSIISVTSSTCLLNNSVHSSIQAQVQPGQALSASEHRALFRPSSEGLEQRLLGPLCEAAAATREAAQGQDPSTQEDCGPGV